jgi:DNA polymerase-3 subunit delta
VTRPAPPRRPAPPASRARPGAAAPTVYLLIGEEDWTAEAALGRILDDVLPAGERDLNLDIVDAGETPIQDVITRSETLPFFGSRRVVVVRRGEAFRVPDQDALADYLDRGSPPSVLVIVAEKLDKRRRLFGVLQRVGRVIPCDRLHPEALPAWIRARVEQAGKTMAPEATQTLAILVGGALRELASEIDKLTAYVGERKTITTEDVRGVASHVAEVTVFELMDAVGHRQAGRALRLLQVVLAEEAPVKVLFMLGDQIRMLLRGKALLERGADEGEARRVLGGRYWLWRQRRLQPQVAAFSRLDVSTVLQLLVQTDTEIKTGQKPPRLALETLIVGLCV